MSNCAKFIKAYALSVKWDSHETIVNASTRGKAKYMYWLDIKDCYPDIQFTELRARVYKDGSPYTSDHFVDVARRRGKSGFRCGDRVLVDGETGYIVGHNSSANFDILFVTGKHSDTVCNVHPSNVELSAES